jgi:transcriptional regulator with XRE-family HTH domain
MNNKNDTEKFLTKVSENLNDEELLLAALQGLIAAEISKKRIALGLNQKEFAEKMGVSQGLVSRWENGDSNFTLGTLVSIAIKLGIEMQCPFVCSYKAQDKDNIVEFPRKALMN